ncbi:ArsR/SmtB family transcription factor [uncultured Sphingomonas sp.]|uniref:ArsR/SmtB family transcription factor n=1 Tax=uncultured Sphingomonas sp. TaxID=158754 RepID=UPI0035CB7ABC
MPHALDIFRALADRSRLRIVVLVRSMELSVGELAQVLGQSQPRVSRHVKILSDAGIVERRKEGSWVFVAIGVRDIVAPLFTALDAWQAGDVEAQSDIARLAEIRADRAAQAAAWFEARAQDWDAIRSLHVAECEVEAAMADLLGDDPVERMIDIGTGTGRMLELFADRAGHALGIDRSSEMLRVARAKLAGRGVDAELRQADLYALPLGDGAAGLAIIHHVLHYAQAPDAAIAEAARVLAAGGRLLVADFAAHAREELRTRDAHVRLGFSDDQILAWFAAAGMTPLRTETLEGGALSVKLWLARKSASGVEGAGKPGRVQVMEAA